MQKYCAFKVTIILEPEPSLTKAYKRNFYTQFRIRVERQLLFIWQFKMQKIERFLLPEEIQFWINITRNKSSHVLTIIFWQSMYICKTYKNTGSSRRLQSPLLVHLPNFLSICENKLIFNIKLSLIDINTIKANN